MERLNVFIAKLSARLEQLAAEKPVFLAFLVFLFATFIVIPISLPAYLTHGESFWLNILAEAHGTLFDLLIIGWFLLWLNKIAEKRVRNNRYREEIDDYLGWKSQEATHRIVGNIRRLNRSGVRDQMRLTEAYLEGANLGGVDLEGADLWGAQLEGATLREANLKGASLAGANLEGADLERATLERADLRGTSLKDADLERAHLYKADLRGVSLTGADLQYADLQEANLERANLTGANLRGTRLTGANLKGANLEGANLRGANLDNANLLEAQLVGTDLLGASLVDAELPEGNDLFSMFEQAKTLFGATFAVEVDRQLQEAYPSLFQMHQRGFYTGETRDAVPPPAEARNPAWSDAEEAP